MACELENTGPPMPTPGFDAPFDSEAVVPESERMSLRIDLADATSCVLRRSDDCGWNGNAIRADPTIEVPQVGRGGQAFALHQPGTAGAPGFATPIASAASSAGAAVPEPASATSTTGATGMNGLQRERSDDRGTTWAAVAGAAVAATMAPAESLPVHPHHEEPPA